MLAVPKSSELLNYISTVTPLTKSVVKRHNTAICKHTRCCATFLHSSLNTGYLIFVFLPEFADILFATTSEKRAYRSDTHTGAGARARTLIIQIVCEGGCARFARSNRYSRRRSLQAIVALVTQLPPVEGLIRNARFELAICHAASQRSRPRSISAAAAFRLPSLFCARAVRDVHPQERTRVAATCIFVDPLIILSDHNRRCDQSSSYFNVMSNAS